MSVKILIVICVSQVEYSGFENCVLAIIVPLWGKDDCTRAIIVPPRGKEPVAGEPIYVTLVEYSGLEPLTSTLPVLRSSQMS